MMIQDNNNDFKSKDNLIEELNGVLLKSKYYKMKKGTSEIPLEEFPITPSTIFSKER